MKPTVQRDLWSGYEPYQRVDDNVITVAFEIESISSIYSGILRMSDLISMQPNLNIPLYIVAPDDRRYKVFKEVNRRTFSKLSPQLPEIVIVYPLP
jgi:hypothetical protein